MDYPSDPTIGLVDGKFSQGDPAQGIPASQDSADWANAVTDEILALISGAGLTPDEENLTQVFQAVQTMIDDRKVFVTNSNGNPNISDVVFQVPNHLSVVPTVVDPDVSIGPTGSGSDGIWTALDAIPNSAKWIEVFVHGWCEAYEGTANGFYEDLGLVAKYGASLSSNSYERYLYKANGYANSSGNLLVPINLSRKIPVDSRRFLLRYGIDGVQLDFTNIYLYFTLTGYGL